MLYRNEATFQIALIARLRELGWWMVPIETRSTIGVPDIYCAKNGHACWLELKMIRPTDNGWYVPFRTGQQSWHLKQYRMAGDPVIIIGYYKGKVYSHEMKKLWRDHIIPYELWEEETL